MNENKTTDEGSLDDNFNNDFHFEDNEPEITPIKITSKQPKNKKVLGGLFTVVLAVILVMGYKIYHASTPTTTTASAKAKITSLATLKPAPLPEPVIPAQQAAVDNPPVPAPAASPTPLPSETTPAEPNFNELAQAFSNTDQPSAATAPKNPGGEGSLQDLQKELFALESPAKAEAPSSNPPASASSNATATPSLATATPNEATEASAPTQLGQNLDKLNQQIEYILSQIRHLDAYSREVSENLTKLNDTINVMDNRLSALTNTTSNLSQDVGHVKQVLQEDGLDINVGLGVEKRRVDAKKNIIAIEEPEYVVHAVIPGRAWLKSLKGQIITVAEGDTIGNYGKILVIDASNGVVLTSSGIAFR